MIDYRLNPKEIAELDALVQQICKTQFQKHQDRDDPAKVEQAETEVARLEARMVEILSGNLT